MHTSAGNPPSVERHSCCTGVLTVDYVNSTSRQPAVTTTLMQTLSTDWISNPVLLGLFLTLIGLSVLLTIAVIIYVVRIRRLCRRSPVGKYATVRANPVEQESARPPSPPTRACEESTDAAAAAVAGSHQHRYTPNSRSQQPFKGFRQTQERNRPV